MLEPLPFVNAFPQNWEAYVPDQWLWTKQYDVVFKLFCMTFTHVKTIFLDCSVAVSMPSSMPVSIRLEFTTCMVEQ